MGKWVTRIFIERLVFCGNFECESCSQLFFSHMTLADTFSPVMGEFWGRKPIVFVCECHTLSLVFVLGEGFDGGRSEVFFWCLVLYILSPVIHVRYG